MFSVENGLLHWVFNTAPSEPTEGEPLPIKSSPCVDPTNGWVWFGSHDHHMYAVDIQVCVCITSNAESRYNHCALDCRENLYCTKCILVGGLVLPPLVLTQHLDWCLELHCKEGS